MSDSSSREDSTPDWLIAQWGDDRSPAREYEPPCVVDIGHVRELTGGSSGSGNADANSQYYW
jgi:hypothetical protein